MWKVSLSPALIPPFRMWWHLHITEEVYPEEGYTMRSAMRSFFWRGADLGRGGALVAWSSVCRPFADGELGIHHLQHANSALLCKWVTRVMQPSDDLVSHLLRESYGSTLDWKE